MTPSARLAAAAEILENLSGGVLPADRFLRAWWAERRYAGSKDRAAVTARVYDVLRHRASYAWRMGSGAPRALVLASLRAEGLSAEEAASLFSGAGYGAPPPSEGEAAALRNWDARDPGTAPPFVAGEYPEWLGPELTRGLGAELGEDMRAMQGRAPVDLRVNTLRVTRGALQAALQQQGFAALPTPFSPMGLRIAAAEGFAPLQRTPDFENGAFEIQDEASQMAALLCTPRPGERVLDLAAGAGGKALALAALMGNEGEIVAYDFDPLRLKPLGPRAQRAGAGIVLPTYAKSPSWESGFDLVLIDAPCSGSGTWRRNPDLKWRLTPDRLRKLTGVQAELLEEGANYVRRGGRLVYATCSLLACENEDVIAGFRAHERGFMPVPAAGQWQTGARLGISPGIPPGMAENFRATPLRTGTDGFFVSILKRA